MCYACVIFSSFWQTDLNPRVVLNKLASKGYKLIQTSGIGQTFVAITFKED